MMSDESKAKLAHIIADVEADIRFCEKGNFQNFCFVLLNGGMACINSIHLWADPSAFNASIVAANATAAILIYLVGRRQRRQLRVLRALRRDLDRASEAKTFTEAELYLDQLDAGFKNLK